MRRLPPPPWWLVMAVLTGLGVFLFYTPSHAAESPDTIPLDEACRLVKKPTVVPAHRHHVAKPVARRKPLFKRDIPAEYDLLCDEGAPAAPLSALPSPLASYPVETLPEAPLLALTGLNVVPESFEEVLNGPRLGYFPSFLGFPSPGPVVFAYAPPPAPVPEPSEWLLVLAGLIFASTEKRRRV